MQLLIIIGLVCLLVAVTAEWLGTLAENRQLSRENDALLDQLCQAVPPPVVDDEMHQAMLNASRELGGTVIAVDFHPVDNPVGKGTCSDCGMTCTDVVPMGNDEFVCANGCDVPLFDDALPVRKYRTPDWV